MPSCSRRRTRERPSSRSRRWRASAPSWRRTPAAPRPSCATAYPATSRPIGDTRALAAHLHDLASPTRARRARSALAGSHDVARAIRVGDHDGRRRCALSEAARRLVRILHIHKITGISGSERHLLSLLPALREQRGGRTVPRARRPGHRCAALLRGARRGGRPVRARPLHVRREPAHGRRRRQSRAPHPSRTCSTPTSCTETSTARSRRRATRVPLVSSRHNDDRYLLGPFRYVDRLFARRARRIIAISDAVRGFLERAGPPAGEARHGALRARQPPAAHHPR